MADCSTFGIGAGIRSSICATLRAGNLLLSILTKGEQTRRKIVEAAAPIFNQHGYEGSSRNALMAVTSLKKSGIYRLFTSKEELAAEAFDYTGEAAWNTRLLHLDEKAHGVEKLKQLIANFVEHRGPVAKALRSWLSRLQVIVEKARERGETQPGSTRKQCQR